MSKNNNVKMIIAMVIVAVMIVMVACHNDDTNNYNDQKVLLETIETLTEENKTLSEENKSLSDENQQLKEMLESADASIKELNNKLEGITNRLVITEKYWMIKEFQINGEYHFEKLDNVSDIVVQLQDELLLPIEVDVNIELDREENILYLNLEADKDEVPSFIKLTIYYSDGRVEDITSLVAFG